VGEKTNEIPCIKPLLADLDIKGAVVRRLRIIKLTIDQLESSDPGDDSQAT